MSGRVFRSEDCSSNLAFASWNVGCVGVVSLSTKMVSIELSANQGCLVVATVLAPLAVVCFK